MVVYGFYSNSEIQHRQKSVFSTGTFKANKSRCNMAVSSIVQSTARRDPYYTRSFWYDRPWSFSG